MLMSMVLLVSLTIMNAQDGCVAEMTSDVEAILHNSASGNFILDDQNNEWNFCNIYSDNGTKVISVKLKKASQIDISDLTNGNYIIEFVNDSFCTRQKFILEESKI